MNDQNITLSNENIFYNDGSFSFTTLNILDGHYNPLPCTVTIYDSDGILKVSDSNASLDIDKITRTSHLSIESEEKHISLDFSINGDCLDPVITIENHGTSNPAGIAPPGSALTFVTVDATNLSYSNLRLTISDLDPGLPIAPGRLKIFRLIQTPETQWIELPTGVDGNSVSTDTGSTSIFAVTLTGTTPHSQNISIGRISVLDSIGTSLAADIEIVGPENTIASSTGTLDIAGVPPGSRLLISSPEKNIMLDFTLDTDSLDPVIILEDFGDENPASDILLPADPISYFMVTAESLGYSDVTLSITNPAIQKGVTLFRLAGTSSNTWEELTTSVDLPGKTITTTLTSDSILALCEKPGVKVKDTSNVPLTVSLQTYDNNRTLQQTTFEHTLPSRQIPEQGFLKIDAMSEKNVAVTFKSPDSSGSDVILDDLGTNNPVHRNPTMPALKFVEVHASNLKFDSADIEIGYSDDDIGSMDETRLQILHYSGGNWVALDSTVDTVDNIVTATTPSLSTFALVYNGTSVNTARSIYQPGETADIIIVVLDNSGAPVINASIAMVVTAPNGNVSNFSTMEDSIAGTSDPGVYEASYLTTTEGEYHIICVAIIEGNESRFETSFVVQETLDFDIVRHAQSKIDPTKYDTFDVTIDVTSYTDDDTITIWEYLPADFVVYTDASVVDADNLKVLTWQRSLFDNRSSVNYSYSVPMEWPKLYQLGPLEIDYGDETFTESRPWYVAVDPTDFILNGDFESGNGTDADYWTESGASWDSSNGNPAGNMYMHVSGSSQNQEGYADQDFTYNGNTTPNSAYLNFDWYRDVSGTGDADLYLQLKVPGSETFDTIWSNTASGAQTWTTVSDLDIASNFTATGDYTLRLYATLTTTTQAYSDADVRWDNVGLNITDVGDSTTAPSISNVANSTPTGTQVYITWDTNQSYSNNRVMYSQNSDLSDYSWSSWVTSTNSVSILLSGLVPDSTYYYSAYSYNGLNGSVYSNSSIYSFTTPGNVTVGGTVKDRNGDPLSCAITVYGDDGSTVLHSISGSSFDWGDVVVGGYVQFEALSSTGTAAKFKITGSSSGAAVILDDYGGNNPESTSAPSGSMKYVGVSATGITYDSVQVRMQYSDSELGGRSENSLKMYHHKDGAWDEMTTTVDAANNILTAETSSLSTFAAAGAKLFDFSITPIITTNNTETQFTLTITNLGSNNLVNVTINCTLPSGWTINASSVSDSGTVSGQTINWNDEIGISSSASVNRYFNATVTALGNYNFTCNASGNVSENQVQNRDFGSGSGVDADYWLESQTGEAVTQWESTGGNPAGNMYMHVEGGSIGNYGKSYCNQSFTYEGPTTPTYASLSFDWNRDVEAVGAQSDYYAYMYVQLKYPNGTVATIWSNTADTDQAWTSVSQDISNYFDNTGTYTFILYSDLYARGAPSYARTRWDNAQIYIRNSYANEGNVTVSLPASAEITGITTNKTSYSSNEDVQINTTVGNTGSADVTGNLNLSIRYLNGTLLNDIAQYLDMLIPYTQSNSTATLWNTSTTPAGNYLAYAEFNYTNQIGVPVSTINYTTFSIAGNINVTVDSAGPYNYEDNLTVSLAGTVNDSEDIGVPSATVNITIYDPDYVWLNSTETTTTANGSYNTTLIVTPSSLGTYTADVYASNSTKDGVGFDSFKIRRLNVTAGTDEDVYTPSASMVVSGVVMDEETGEFTGSASINATMYDSNWTFIKSKTTISGTDGSYTVAFISPLTEDGYHINVTATDSYGIRGEGQAEFDVSLVTTMTIYGTDKAVYLLDPYQWVYLDTGNVSGCYPNGHPEYVLLDIMVLDQRGHLVNASVSYDVYNTNGLIYSGTAMEKRHGFYNATFQINESDGTGDYTAEVTATYGTITGTVSVPFRVNRWGCDTCHGTGAFSGSSQHDDWEGVLGGADGGSVNYSNLVNYELTHTPDAGTDNHESVGDRGGACAGCHSGSNSVECTQCHTGYMLGVHQNVVESSAPSTTCANASCHGHINVGDLPGDLGNRYPNCTDCHPISYLDNTITPPVFFRNNNATRNPGIHPGGTGLNETVNCSFCHYSFHRIQAETWTLNNRNCTSCHTTAEDFTNHSYDDVTCAGCHQFSADSNKWHQWYGSTAELEYHNITEPSCLTCHPGYENHSSYQTTGVSCQQCHDNNPIYSYDGSIMRSGVTYAAGTSIHSIYNDTSVSRSLIPRCTVCHDNEYYNHSSYNSSGVYCTYCHDNVTLDYSSSRKLLVNDTGVYNTSYNVGTEIHSETGSDMIPNCTDCHGSAEYNTHLGDETEVEAGTAANCTQCHDNVTLGYTGSAFPVGSYNTNGDIHNTTRIAMLPNQTADLNDSCAICHVTVYNESTRTHSNYTECYKCHYDPDLQYQGVVQDRPMEHTTNETIDCRVCHFDYDRVVTTIGKPRYWINGTMFGASVHGNQSVIDCRDCHTQYHRPPEYAWKWCECCHSYQSDPINDRDRHNITLKPQNYLLDGTSVLDITDCTTCHNSTLYDTSKSTFNRTSGKDCRYCHTYPDQNYY